MSIKDPIFSVRHLTTRLLIEGKAYTVVDDLSFDLQKGSTLAIVGESGSGKSMTALSLLRILPEPPALKPEGEVLYQGVNLLTLPESKMQQIRGAKISMIFQNPKNAFNPVYTIGEQLLEVVKVHLNLVGKGAEEHVISSLKDVALKSDVLKRYPHELSGGMLQRAMIAMALLCSPDILIADEATTSLDVTIQAQILELLKELQSKKHMAILLITHDMGVVAEMADDVMIMYASQKIEEGPVNQIFDTPTHPYTSALFQSRHSEFQEKGHSFSIKGIPPTLTDLKKGCFFRPRCPFAIDICKEKPVPFFSKEKGHQIRCWLSDPNLTEKISYDDEDPT